MLKQKEGKEEKQVPESETPPSIEVAPSNASTQQYQNAKLIQSIISSNEELIYQQAATIKYMQIANSQQETAIKQLTKKHESLLQFLSQSASPNSTAEKDCKNSQSTNESGLSASVFKIEDMVNRISELEQELSKTKIELALKSDQLLSMSSRRKKSISQIKIIRNKSELFEENNKTQEYFSPKHKGKPTMPTNKNTFPQNKQQTELWSKQLESFGTSQIKIEKFKQKTQSLIKRFIPKQLRSKVWATLIDNKLGMTNSLYIHLLQRRAKSWVCEKVRQQIDKDIKRSFYGKTQYETKTGLILEVCQFLEIFHIFRPDVSYVQGMTYPAIILIPILGKIRAFNLFCNLVLGNSFFRRVLSLQDTFISTVCRSFELLLSDTQPDLSEKMQKSSVQSQIFLIEWLFTFFSRGLSFETTLKFWDHILYFQELAIFRIGLSVFEQLGPKIMQANYEESIILVRNYGQHIDEERLLESLSNHKLTSQKLNRAIQKAGGKKI